MSPELIRILLVSTDEAVRDGVLAALPSGEGYEVMAPPTLDHALEAAASRPDVVLVEAGGAAGASDALGHVLAGAGGRPVIAITPADRPAFGEQAVRQGCSDYLTYESLSPELVQKAVRYAVEAGRAERARRMAEQALVDSEQRYRSLFEQSRDAIYMTERDGEIVELNRAALELFGSAAYELIGRDICTLFADLTDRERFQREIEMKGEVRELEVRLRRKEGGNRWGLISAWIRRDEDGAVKGYQGIIHDITERKQAEERLIHQAFHDPLTRLPNRALFMDRLERAVARRRRGEVIDLAVLFLDMDRFKFVNDTLGHMAGDELLRRMARLLSAEVREEDTVARIGGDEFAILLDGVADPAVPTHVAERVQNRLRSPFRLHGQDVFTSVSIGITFGGADTEGPEDLLRRADTAMYRAKELGPARYQIYDQAMHLHAVTALQLETDLRLAVERHDFVLHYQPLLELSGGTVIGFEALVRWEHPERGLLPPQAFIPIAEETGLIVSLGQWVLKEATRQLREWQRLDHSFERLFVSVNLSARQFSTPHLAETVRSILDESGLPAPSLRLEITESAMMVNPLGAVETLRQLRAAGVILCIDDFGTGYSSLNTIHQLPVDILKIDRSFINRLEDSDEGRMVETILALARNLGMETVAEGVETEGQLKQLRALGSASVQGFLFSTPLDAEAARAFLEKHRP